MTSPHLQSRMAGRRRQRRGMTLVELLVSSVIIALLCGILMQMTGLTGKIWRSTKAKIEQFQAARSAFDSMTRKISQATLNTYWDYDKVNATSAASGAPSRYVRQSELRFICGEMPGGLMPNSTSYAWSSKGVFFHAPLGHIVPESGPRNYRGLENLLNVWGYFVEFGNDKDMRPSFASESIMPVRHRFRLMELMAPSQHLFTYTKTSGMSGTSRANLIYQGREWFTNFVNPPNALKTTRPVRPLAENVVALLFVPKLSKQDEERRAASSLEPLCKDFQYDTFYNQSKSYPDPELNPSNQLPPILQVTMVALDEASAARLADKQGTTMPLLGANLFKDTRKLLDNASTPEPGDGDLAALGKELTATKLNYRVFTTDVSIRSAKWSREQK